MKQLISLLLILTCSLVTLGQTCDLVLAGYTPSAVEGGIHTFVIQFPNTENCGCNEYTQADGNTCEDAVSPAVHNNETVSHIVMGIHYIDEETGLDLGENTDCTSTTFSPGWSYVLSITEPVAGWVSGSATTIGINVPYAWECILNTPIDGYCWEVVIWQINYSQTANYDDFPEDGWSSGTQGSATQMYPDINLDDNRISFCPDPVVADTVYVYETDTVFVSLPPDTIYVPWEWYFYDTVYVDVFDTVFVNTIDTLVVTEVETEYVYLVDTLMQEVVVYEYILNTDTVYEYGIEFIDCTTGLPCDEDGFWEEDCRSVFVPNAFSPNNDGINDAFFAVSTGDCWLDWSLSVYNRWGDLVWETNDPDEYWYGQVSTHYASDGTYAWVLKAEGPGRSLDLAGTVTLLR